MYYGKGYPATKASGFSKVIPSYGSFVTPGFGAKGGFAKPIGKPFGIGGGFGKPLGKGFGKTIPAGKGVFPGYGATKATGFNYAVPTTTVATSPYPGAI